MNFNINDKFPKAALGDLIQLNKGEPIPVVECQETKALMLNIDAHQLQPGDLSYIKKLGLTISNPDTDKPVALGVDFVEKSFGEKIKSFFDSDDEDDDDSDLFAPAAVGALGGIFGGSPSFGGFSGGGFGGFGGGAFSGGGASRGF